MTALSPSELALLRTRPHYTRLYLSVYKPNILARATVVSGYDRGTQQIYYENVTGDPTLVIPGMTVWIGTTAGGNDLGKLRVKDITPASFLLLVPDNAVVWQAGAYLTFLEFFDIWPIYYRQFYDGDNVPTYYMDYDIPYTDQGEILEPVPMMGPHRAGILNTNTGIKSFYFDGSDSYDLSDPAPVFTYSWSFGGANTPTSAVATPGWIDWDTPGYYTVSLTVTNTNSGKSFTGYRHIAVHTDVGLASPPFTNWSTNSLRGDIGVGGWSGQIVVRQDVGPDPQVSGSIGDIVDGALIVIFASDIYGSTAQSIGGNYPNCEDIVFVGYVRDGSLSVDPETSAVSFAVSNLQGRMQSRELNSLTLSATSQVSWYYLKDMTVDKAIYQMLRWETTTYLIADVVPNGNTLLVERMDYSRAFMFGSLNQTIQGTLLGNAAVDRQGRLWLETTADYIPILSRNLNTVISMTRTDWQGNLDIKYNREKKVSNVEISGVAYSGATDDIETSFISTAPGLAPGYEGAPTSINSLVLEDQTKTNQLAGDILESINKDFPEVNVTFSGNYRIVDIAPQERVLITLDPTENYLNLSWTEKSFIPKSVDFSYNGLLSTLSVKASLSEETNGVAGIAGPYPKDMSTDTGGTVFEDVPDGGVPGLGPEEGSGNNTFVATTSKIGFTLNLLSSSPNWRDITNEINGETIADFILDPYDPKNTAYCITSTGVWKTRNSMSSIPSWTRMLYIVGTGPNQFASNLSPSLVRAKASIALQGAIRVLGYAKPSSSSAVYNQYCYVTNDGGTTWTRYATGGTGGGAASFTFDTDLEGWAFTTTRVCPITYLALDWSPNYGVGSSGVYWDGTRGHTTAGCMRIYQQSSGGSTARSSTTAVYSVTKTVTTGEIALDFWWQHPTGCFSPEIFVRITFTDNTCQDYAADIAGASATWHNSSFAIDIANNGKTVNTVMIGMLQNGLDGTCNQELLIDDLTIFGTGPTDGPIVHAFDAGQHNSDIFYAGTSSNIRRSTNGGVAWSAYISGVGANDIECHYNNNLSDANLTFWGDDGNLYRTSGTTPTSILSETVDGTEIRSGRIVSYVLDSSVIYALKCVGASQFDLVRTQNGGTNWTTLASNVTDAKAIGLWPWGTFDPATQGVFLLNGSNILYSTNGGTSFGIKNGDWATVMGSAFSNPIMIVPVWVS